MSRFAQSQVDLVVLFNSPRSDAGVFYLQISQLVCTCEIGCLDS